MLSSYTLAFASLVDNFLKRSPKIIGSFKCKILRNWFLIMHKGSPRNPSMGEDAPENHFTGDNEAQNKVVFFSRRVSYFFWMLLQFLNV